MHMLLLGAALTSSIWILFLYSSYRKRGYVKSDLEDYFAVLEAEFRITKKLHAWSAKDGWNSPHSLLTEKTRRQILNDIEKAIRLANNRKN